MAKDKFWNMLERAGELADWSLPALRHHLCGFHCDDPPSQAEADSVFKGKTRGDLIRSILSEEFDAELSNED